MFYLCNIVYVPEYGISYSPLAITLEKIAGSTEEADRWIERKTTKIEQDNGVILCQCVHSLTSLRERQLEKQQRQSTSTDPIAAKEDES